MKIACKNCGAFLEINELKKTYICPYCNVANYIDSTNGALVFYEIDRKIEKNEIRDRIASFLVEKQKENLSFSIVSIDEGKLYFGEKENDIVLLNENSYPETYKIKTVAGVMRMVEKIDDSSLKFTVPVSEFEKIIILPVYFAEINFNNEKLRFTMDGFSGVLYSEKEFVRIKTKLQKIVEFYVICSFLFSALFTFLFWDYKLFIVAFLLLNMLFFIYITNVRIGGK